MPDKSMCLGRGCPAKNRCYRFIAPPDLLGQAYGNFDELRGENGICKEFLDTSPVDDISDNGFVPIDKNGGRE